MTWVSEMTEGLENNISFFWSPFSPVQMKASHDGYFPAPGGKLGLLLVSEWEGWEESSGFLSQPLELPRLAVGAAGAEMWPAGHSPSGSGTFPARGVWHSRDGGLCLLMGCHQFSLNLGSALCASKSLTPVLGWGMESAKRKHKMGISWIGGERQGSSNPRDSDLFLQTTQVTQTGP